MGVVDCEYILFDHCGIRFRFQFFSVAPSLPDRKRMAQLSAEILRRAPSFAKVPPPQDDSGDLFG